jgi:beta-glucanase (GH16 family)
MPIEWQLAWFDEFDGNEVDRTKWNFEVGGDGWGNGEAQYYTNGSNSSVKDGYLIIEARKENYSNNRYTSSRMNNGGKGSFLYGRVEVKAKLPRTGGTWPAIWTLPTDWIYGNWPDCGEIDIMEHRGNYLNYVFGTIHTGAYNHVDGTAKSGGKMFSDVVNTFHIYALEWYPDHLDWYYDDELIFTFENEYKTFAEWPYDIKHHVMLNLAIGGGLGGNIDYNGVWPQQMIVDYVRIYDFNLGAGDTIPPTVPTNLTANVSGITANLSWEIASDNNYVDRYLIFQNGELIDSVSGSQYEIKYLEPLTAYTYSVQAKDFGGNYSEKANITFSTEEIESLSVPGKFEAEDYLYMEGMQQESCTDAGGGVNLAYIDAGDWVEYSINVIQSGDYILDVRAASLNSKGKFQLLNEDHQVLTAVETPVTGGWQTWRTTSSKSFHLNKGIQRIKIIAQAKEFNLNWFSILDNTSTAISKNLFHGDDLIYPNPFDGKELTIQLSKRTNNTEVSIHDIEQRIVFMKVYKNAEKQITLNNLNLKSGIYIMNIKRENDVSVYKLIVD